jgi:DNA-binding transcriptional MocR family regulator
MTGLQRVTVSPLSHDAPLPLVEQITGYLRTRIDERALRAGTRMPSIRRFAEDNGVSRFTVVEAYDRLVAQGYLESRRGSGFYIRERPQPVRRAPEPREPAATRIDVVWLLHHLYAGNDNRDVLLAGSGCLPESWLDEEMLQSGLRALSRREPSALTGYGTPRGYAPLRNLLQVHLAELEIRAEPDNIVLTAGASHALDLVARYFLQPGDAVLVDDPGWAVEHARLTGMGMHLLPVPRLAAGPDLEVMRQMIIAHRPRLYVTVSVLHNPTGATLSLAAAHQVLQMAEAHDLILVEDDTYAWLAPAHAPRLAALDGLRRTIYVTGFSKILAPNWRVGALAAPPALVDAIVDTKLLSSLTTPALLERAVAWCLDQGLLRRHAERVSARLAAARTRVVRLAQDAGCRFAAEPQGLFGWVETGLDTEPLAVRLASEGWLIAPGRLFHVPSRSSTLMRVNFASAQDARFWRAFERARDVLR